MTAFLSSVILMSGTGGGGLGQVQTFLPFIMIIVVMYFFMIRPQAKKAKDQASFKDNLNKGDKIVTIGGIHARIVEKRDNTFLIDAGNGQKFEIEKSAVSMELTKGIQKNAAPIAEK
ncbi:MAG: preprotein translocase subunit YajC [Sphingobacteriales bacterium]|nr:MAG: preprotein translocase subunit YajC [Sphingobacteriales bacterium]